MKRRTIKQKKKSFRKIPLFIDRSNNIKFGNNWDAETWGYRNQYIQVQWESTCEGSSIIMEVQKTIDCSLCLVCKNYIISSLRHIPDTLTEDPIKRRFVSDSCNQKYECLIQLDTMLKVIVRQSTGENTSDSKYDPEKTSKLISQFESFTFSGCCSPTCREFLYKKMYF